MFQYVDFLKSLSVKISMIHVIMENLQSLDMPTNNEFYKSTYKHSKNLFSLQVRQLGKYKDKFNMFSPLVPCF
jgi:hypothetical protein